MFQRFAAASAIASMALGLAALVLLVITGLSLQRFYPVTIVWCVMPLVWGLWAMLAPNAWVPQRLPWWGAMLGLIAGLFVAFVLNLPFRVFGETVPTLLRGVGVLALVVFYFVLWILVRLAYRSLADPSSS